MDSVTLTSDCHQVPCRTSRIFKTELQKITSAALFRSAITGQVDIFHDVCDCLKHLNILFFNAIFTVMFSCLELLDLQSNIDLVDVLGNGTGTLVISLTAFHYSSGIDCYCDVKRMFVTFDTFCNLWFPLLISLGLYCLGDGEFKDAKAKENAIDLTNVRQISCPFALQTKLS